MNRVNLCAYFSYLSKYLHCIKLEIAFLIKKLKEVSRSYCPSFTLCRQVRECFVPLLESTLHLQDWPVPVG